MGTTRTTEAKNGKTVKPSTSQDQNVEVCREKTDQIFVILADFGNESSPSYPDQDTDPTTPGPTTFEGHRNNKIPAPTP